MNYLTFNAQRMALGDDSVLDCLLNNGQEIPYACKAGNCHSCLVQTVQGQPPAQAQVGLKQTQRAQGYGLACQWTSTEDVSVALPHVKQSAIKAKISQLRWLNEDVLRLRLRIVDSLVIKPGQFINLVNSAGVSRSYSLANDPQNDDYLEFHIKIHAHGEFSRWLADEAKVDQTLCIEQAKGDCIYVAGQQSQALILAGVGTGLAPLIGIAMDALTNNHTGTITLYHGAASFDTLYYVDKLKRLAATHKNFKYIACVKDDAQCIAQGQDNIIKAVLNDLQGDMRNMQVYLCGGELFVKNLRKQVFLQGISAKNIHCDAFTVQQVSNKLS